jgi:arylsulfatase A-like enzyme
MSRAVRLLCIVLVALVGVLVAVGVANERALGGDFYDGLDALLKRAIAVRAAARPEYQRDALAALPENPNVGPVVRLDDRIAEARIIEEPVRTAAYTGFENVFALEFDAADLTTRQGGAMRPQVRDGVLVVTQTRDEYLRNSQPVAIVTDDVGEVVIRARARKGKHFTLGWSRTPDPDKPWRFRLQIPMIADGEFHNYFVNARGALRRGIDDGNQIQFLAVQPSDVDGDEVEIDFIRFLSTRSKYMRKPRDVLYETIAGEMRPAMSMLPRQTLEFGAHIPADEPRLSFGTAVIGVDSRIDFIVQVVSDGKTTELHRQSVDAPGAWHDASYDLSSWAGRDVALRLTVDGQVGSVGLWSSPTIYGKPKQPLRVMVFLEDAERADHLSLYGYDKPTSPFKEELLQDKGAVFLRASAQDNVTRASVPSMMTSLLPSVTGVWGFADMLRAEFLTLAEVMRQQGFATASFVQNSNAGPAAGLHQGFDVTADEVARGRSEKLLEGEPLWNWLHSHKDRNSFLYLHIADPHGPYDPPPPYDAPYRALTSTEGMQERLESVDPEWVNSPTREGRMALYDGEIRHNDEVLRRFFARLRSEGLFDDTLFVFVADHGEHFGEHGVWTHRPPGHVQVTGVPLVLLHPQKIPKPLRITESVQLLDVMPTVLEFAGVDASGLAMQGDSLASLVAGRDVEFWRNRVIASEEVTMRDKVNTGRNRGLRVSGSLFYRNWHFIASRTFWPQRGFWPESLRLKVFNLTSDPQEHSALRRFLPDAYLRYKYTVGLNRLQSISEEAGRMFRSSDEQDFEFDPDTLEHLKALGYVQ